MSTSVLPLVAYVVIYFVDGTGFHPNGDGYYSWIYARSLVFDGDLDFRNDYALCGDPAMVGSDRGTGHPDNPFYIGPAAFWALPLLVLRLIFAVFLGSDAAARASCGGWMTALTILMGPLGGALSVWFSYAAAKLVVDARIAAFTALLFAFTSPLFPYSTSVGHYSHIYLTLLIASVTYLSLRMALFGPRRCDWLWLGLAVALAVLHRLPAVIYAAVPTGAAMALALHRHFPRKELASAAFGGLIGVVLTCALYKYIYGTWLALPQGPHYVHLAHGHPWLLLFGVHGGFFFWMPAAWLAVPGLWLALRRRDTRMVTLGCLASAVAEVVISSSPLDWHGSWSLGARRLLPLVPFVIVFSALALARVSKWATWSWTREAAALVVLLALTNNVIASTTIRGDRNLSQWELYGAASPLRPLWWALDRIGLDIALLPAELYFAARYRLPTSAYREALTPRYRRSYRNLHFSDETLDLREPWAASVTSRAWSERGIDIGSEVARVVFTAEWPFATHARLLVQADRNALLEVSEGGWFGSRTVLGRLLIRGGNPMWVELPLPTGTFDSGLNEWLFQSAGGRIVVQTIALEDRTPRVPYDSAY